MPRLLTTNSWPTTDKDASDDSFQWMFIFMILQFKPFGDSLGQIHDCYSSKGCIAFVYRLETVWDKFMTVTARKAASLSYTG
ncbi:hypothetical protein QE152_g10979 [Popillia japonica]|uniref:Uncharacterized protein n=2 Tax=Popillia japonica TaxID=7064 RepID=A0AAW1LT66_POPJA